MLENDLIKKHVTVYSEVCLTLFISLWRGNCTTSTNQTQIRRLVTRKLTHFVLSNLPKSLGYDDFGTSRINTMLKNTFLLIHVLEENFHSCSLNTANYHNR